MRAYNEAMRVRPALVVVPMGDWLRACRRVRLGRIAGPDAVAVARYRPTIMWPAVPSMIADARSPALVVGAGSDSVNGLARGRRAGATAALSGLAGVVRAARRFPQDHPLFAGDPALAAAGPCARRSPPAASWSPLGAAAFRAVHPRRAGPVRSSRARWFGHHRQPGRSASAAPVSSRWSPPVAAMQCRALVARVPERVRAASPSPMRRPPHLDPTRPRCPAASRPCLRRAGGSRCRPTRGRVGETPVEPARALPAPPDKPPCLATTPRPTAAWGSATGRLDRAAHGRYPATVIVSGRRRVVDVSDQVVVERRAVSTSARC